MAWRSMRGWTQNGTQGFKTRQEARYAALRTLAHYDATRPTLYWKLGRIHSEVSSTGRRYWVADMFYRYGADRSKQP